MIRAALQHGKANGEHSSECTTPIRLEVGIGTDPGLSRRNRPNEDAVVALIGQPTAADSQPVGLFVVADGMGGHANGQEASQVAVQVIQQRLTCRVPLPGEQQAEHERAVDVLKQAVQHANQAVYERNRELEQDSHDKMGTTLAAALVIGNSASVVNVGDSRIYLYRQGEGLSQITRDHSVVARLVEDGAITQEEIYTHPKRNQIYRCLGVYEIVVVKEKRIGYPL